MKNNTVNKFFKHIISTALAISLATIPALSFSPSLTVYAGNDYNDDGKDGDSQAHGTGKGGVGAAKTGVLFYCLNSETGEIYNRRSGSDADQGVVLLYSKPDTRFDRIKAKGEEPNLDVKESYYSYKILGDELSDSKYNMPKLFTWNDSKSQFESHYSEWNDWFTQTVTDPSDGRTIYMGEYIVKRFFPEQWHEAAAAHNNGQEAHISLLAEPVAWHSLFKTGSPDSAISGTEMLTSAGWAGIKQKEKIDNVKTFTCSFDRGILAWTMRLERIQFGWWTFGPAMKTSGLLTNDEIIQNGYGVNIYNYSDSSDLHTIKTPTPSPAEVKSPTATNLSVIKVYESINPETQELITDGTFITTDCYSNLSINSEDTWEIISAETVSPLITSVGSIEPYDTITQGKTKKQEFDVAYY